MGIDDGSGKGAGNVKAGVAFTVTAELVDEELEFEVIGSFPTVKPSPTIAPPVANPARSALAGDRAPERLKAVVTNAPPMTAPKMKNPNFDVV